MNFYSELENIFRKQILDSYPLDWEENYITRTLLFEYRKLFRNIEINGLSPLPIRIESTGYKLTGKPESNFWDIAIIVRITHPEIPTFEGVASLEAKKIHKKSRKFEEIKGKQLDIISSQSKYSMLLMYDFEPIQKHHDYSFFSSTTKPTHVAVVPIDIVESIVKEKTSSLSSPKKISLDSNSLYKFSVPLAYQIVFRYFRGLDLEFNESLLKLVKGYETESRLVARERNLPQYILQVSVSYGDSYIDTEFDVNRGVFTEITSSELED